MWLKRLPRRWISTSFSKILMQKMAAYFEPATWALILLDESSQQPQYVAPVEPDFERLTR